MLGRTLPLLFKFTAYCVFGLFFLVSLAYPTSAESTPPVTTHSLSGTAGQNNWYRSNISVTLTTNDAGSGPDSTTYWVNAGTPIVVDHASGSAPSFLNNSFEQGSFSNINRWNAGPGGLVLYYQSNVSPYQGNRTAAIAFVGMSGNYYYWTNESNSVAFTPGTQIEVSAWARTVMFNGDYAYFEVWGQNSSGSGDVLLATSPQLEGFIWGWRNATVQFTVPSTTNYIYLRLGAVGTPAALVYWDNVQTRNVNATAQTTFTHTQDGTHTLHYYSRDNDGNNETEKTTQLKKDTVAPNPWQNFASVNGSCTACFSTSAEVIDPTSGIDVSTAEYRYYTKFNNQFWSNWSAVSSVELVSSGASATDGTTSFVRLETPELNFGDNNDRPFRVQFRTYDLAGNSSDSPVYEIASPWIKVTGSIYVDGEIAIPYPPTGENHSDADSFSGTDIVTFANDPNWYDESYVHSLSGISSIDDLLPDYAALLAQSVALPSGSLPTTDGVYVVNGDFDIKSSTIPSSYDTADVSAIVIIRGNVTVMSDYTVGNNNRTVFIVEGEVEVLPNVEQMAGFFIVENQFVSDSSGQSHRPLAVNGSVIAFDGYELPRDLGDGSSPNNLDTPAERFNWQAGFLLDPVIAGYLTSQPTRYIWQEVEKP